MNILVLGATGFVGRNLISSLEKTNHSIAAFVRDTQKQNLPENIDIIHGDLLNPSSIKDINKKIDVVYYLVHSLKSGKNFAEKDRKAATNFVENIDHLDIKRVIYLSGLGETKKNLSEHLSSRQEIENVLSKGNYKLTTFRSAIIIGKGSAGFTIIKQLADRLPIMITPRWVRTECQPIAIEDVIKYLIKSLDIPETEDKTFEIGGPEILAYQEMIKKTARHIGKKPLIIPFPFLSLKLSVYWIDLVTDIPKEIAHPLVYGLRNSVVVKDDKIKKYIKIDLTPIDTAIKNHIK